MHRHLEHRRATRILRGARSHLSDLGAQRVRDLFGDVAEVRLLRDSVFVHSGAFGNISVKLTAKPANLNTMVARFASIGEAIDACEYWYGPYPYSHVGYVHTTDGAMEIATNVAYPEFMNNESLMENRGLFAHELAHHWWGNKVTPRTHNDMWLKEGPAEYSGHLLEEWAFGDEAFVDVVKDNHLDVLTNAHLDDGGLPGVVAAAR